MADTMPIQDFVNYLKSRVTHHEKAVNAARKMVINAAEVGDDRIMLRNANLVVTERHQLDMYQLAVHVAATRSPWEFMTWLFSVMSSGIDNQERASIIGTAHLAVMDDIWQTFKTVEVKIDRP